MYSCLLVLLMPFSILILCVRLLTRTEGYDFRRLQRYGLIKTPVKTGGVLIHCVSVGEVVAASKLISHMLNKHPDLVVTITTTTPTGAERVKQIFGPKVNHIYLPFDLCLAMSAMLDKIQPEKVLITEVELWPNLIHAAWKKGIPVYVINARMTDKSSRNYQKISALFAPMLEKVYHVCAQGQRDFDNYLELGLDRSKLTLTNNIKFDLEATVTTDQSEQISKKYNPMDKTLILGGSTHDPEEKLLIEAFKSTRNAHNNTLLVIVPRHPQRFDKTWQVCKQSGLTAARSSEYSDQNIDILLVDEMGVLADLYSIADMAFIGGSLADKGGHNALEAAIYSVPAIMGPHTYNNPEICKVLEQAEGLKIVDGPDTLSECLELWLSDEKLRKQNGANSLKMLKQNQGAIEKTLKVIQSSNHTDEAGQNA